MWESLNLKDVVALTMDAFITTPYAERVPGHPVSFAASLTDNAPILNALVWASVENPDGVVVNTVLFDDGLHNDGAAGDGVYGGTFYQTGIYGSYNVTIIAFGYSPSLDSYFWRSKVLSFHMARVDENGDEIVPVIPDPDGDGTPYDWEVFFWPWTDPLVFDSNADPDNDGSNNQEEWEQGTDPGDPDTDDDGEADGTDPEPTNPVVGTPLEAPTAYAYPLVGQVVIAQVSL